MFMKFFDVVSVLGILLIVLLLDVFALSDMTFQI